MKFWGWIFVITAVLNIVRACAALNVGNDTAFGSSIGGVIMFGVLGIFLIHRGNQKEKEKNDKDNWENS